MDKLKKIISEHKPTLVSFETWCEWNSFIFWEKMNWREFTWINFYTEYSNKFYITISGALLGFGFRCWINIEKKDA